MHCGFFFNVFVLFWHILHVHFLSWQDGAELGALTLELSSMGSIPNSTINCLIGDSRGGCCISGYTVSRMDIKPSIPSASLSR